MIPKGSWQRYFELGDNLTRPEWVFALLVGPTVVLNLTPAPVCELLWRNAYAQMYLFLAVCNIPVLLSRKMIYVDIAWPAGLVTIAIVAGTYGQGLLVRRLLASVILGLHGGRMLVGAVAMFGQKSGWTFRFKQDLPRYLYAQRRWVDDFGMPQGTWWVRQQMEASQQMLANIVTLATPVVLMASNPHPEISPMELLGCVMWAVSWWWENTADFQKLAFDVSITKAAAKDKGTHTTKTTKAAAAAPVIGMGEHSGPNFWCWETCRHPNYFGEWLCWTGIAMAAVPSVMTMWSDFAPSVGWILAAILLSVPRLMYNCLVHWTGAGPAEYYSFRKRPLYADYQASVNCFFPSFLCLPDWLVDHHRVSGWPDIKGTRD